MSEETVEELRVRLADARQQLKEIEDLLEAAPDDDELLGMKSDSMEVVALTEQQLRQKEQEESKSSYFSSSSSASSQANLFAVGTICEAKFSEDGVWYKAEITSILDGGKYHVRYTEYGNAEVVSIADIRPLPEASKKAANNPLKRPAVPDAFQQIPKSLQVLPTDSEEVRLAKRKRVKAIKSANRLKEREDEGKSKKSAWESFQKKPKKAVPMALSHKKKESIFKSPDGGGRIGVTGSGMNTPFCPSPLAFIAFTHLIISFLSLYYSYRKTYDPAHFTEGYFQHDLNQEIRHLHARHHQQRGGLVPLYHPPPFVTINKRYESLVYFAFRLLSRLSAVVVVVVLITYDFYCN